MPHISTYENLHAKQNDLYFVNPSKRTQFLGVSEETVEEFVGRD